MREGVMIKYVERGCLRVSAISRGTSRVGWVQVAKAKRMLCRFAGPTSVSLFPSALV